MSANIIRLARQLHGDRSGTVLIEFAIGLPLFLVTTMMGLEVANRALAHQAMSNVSKMVADTAARGEIAIDEQDVSDLFIGAMKSAGRYHFGSNGRVILSSLRPSPTGTGNWIEWQRCAGELSKLPPENSKSGSEENVLSAYGNEGDGKDSSVPPVKDVHGLVASGSTAIILAEVTYVYKPLVDIPLSEVLGPMTIRYDSAFIVRERDDYSITNTSGMSNANKMLCSKFSTPT